MLLTHVIASVGWLGAVAAFLALAIAGFTLDDPAAARAMYMAMQTLGVVALVPLCLASLVTGVIQSLSTPWGLFRHYWVLVKLSITVLATVVLLLYTATLRGLADAALTPALADDKQLLPSPSPVLHATAAISVLLIAVVLSVYKPRGLTPHGWRASQEQRRARQA